MNIGISVSRVGSNAQTKMMKQVAGRLRLALAQYRELAAFARFGSDLDKATLAQLTRGEKMVEILKQDEDVPQATERQVLLIFAANEGLLDDLPTASLKRFEMEYQKFMDEKYPDVVHQLRDKKAFDKNLEAEARKAAGEFKAQFAKSLK
jgi:F-type H+-transporting ATPase subunit alpha